MALIILITRNEEHSCLSIFTFLISFPTIFPCLPHLTADISSQNERLVGPSLFPYSSGKLYLRTRSDALSCESEYFGGRGQQVSDGSGQRGERRWDG